MNKREGKKFYCSSSSKEHIKLSQRSTTELFSTLQLKYSRNRRLKCESIFNAVPGRQCAVDFKNNFPVGSGLGESLKTLSIIIIVKLLNTKEEVKPNRTRKLQLILRLSQYNFHSTFSSQFRIHYLNTSLTHNPSPPKTVKHLFTIYRVRYSVSFLFISKYQRNSCLSTLH